MSWGQTKLAKEKYPASDSPTHSRSCKLASGTCAKPHLNSQYRPPERARTPRASRVTVRAPIPLPLDTVPLSEDRGNYSRHATHDPRPPLLPQVLIKMRVALLAIALMGLVLGANAGAVDLTSSNFDTEVFESGKAAFVKFLAPWCVPHVEPPRPHLEISAAHDRARRGGATGRSIHRRARFPAPRRWIDRPVAPATRYRRGHRPARHGTPPTVDPPPGARSPNVASSFFFEPRKSIDRESLADRPVPLPLPLDTGEATASR